MSRSKENISNIDIKESFESPKNKIEFLNNLEVFFLSKNLSDDLQNQSKQLRNQLETVRQEQITMNQIIGNISDELLSSKLYEMENMFRDFNQQVNQQNEENLQNLKQLKTEKYQIQHTNIKMTSQIKKLERYLLDNI